MSQDYWKALAKAGHIDRANKERFTIALAE